MRICIAEAIGTFCLVFCGTGAIVIDELTAGGVSHVGIALTFGLVVMAMIYAVGDVSGAHLNPAVTVGFFVARRLPAARASLYIAAQTVGALIASAAILCIFGNHANLGMTQPTRPGVAARSDWRRYFDRNADVRDSLPVSTGS